MACAGSELDLDAGTWTLPAERSKNHRAHAITLPAPALEILRAIPCRPDRDHVFGVRSEGFVRWPEKKQTLNRLLGDRVKPWVVHDLRRSAATHMAELGVMPHVMGRIWAIAARTSPRPTTAAAMTVKLPLPWNAGASTCWPWPKGARSMGTW